MSDTTPLVWLSIPKDIDMTDDEIKASKDQIFLKEYDGKPYYSLDAGMKRL